MYENVRDMRNIFELICACGGLEVACWPLVPKFAGKEGNVGRAYECMRM